MKGDKSRKQNPRNQFDSSRRKGKLEKLLRLGSNLDGGVDVSGGGSSDWGEDSGGEGRVGSGGVRFSSSAIEQVF